MDSGAVAPDDAVRQIGRRIAELRRRVGLTQGDLAKKLRVTIPWISRVERVGENLTVRSLVRIAAAIGVEPRRLWEVPRHAPKIQRGRPKARRAKKDRPNTGLAVPGRYHRRSTMTAD